MGAPTRWETDTDDGHSQWYIERFRTMAAEGADLFGEARLIDAMLPRGARVLDAGCGPGRLTGYLHAQGHDAVGVDADPALIEAAQVDHPGPTYVVADLADLDLAAHGQPEPFQGAFLAGNVLAFVASGSEGDVLRSVAAHLVPDGFLAVGFHIARVPLVDFDRPAAEAGLRQEHRFGTWDVRAFDDASDFAVTILRTPPAS